MDTDSPESHPKPGVRVRGIIGLWFYRVINLFILPVYRLIVADAPKEAVALNTLLPLLPLSRRPRPWCNAGQARLPVTDQMRHTPCYRGRGRAISRARSYSGSNRRLHFSIVRVCVYGGGYIWYIWPPASIESRLLPERLRLHHSRPQNRLLAEHPQSRRA